MTNLTAMRSVADPTAVESAPRAAALTDPALFALGARPVLALDHDPDLGAALDPQERAQARRVCIAHIAHVPRGEWRVPDESLQAERSDIVGFILIEGTLCREVGLGAYRSIELLCGGDVLLVPVEDLEADPPLFPLVHTALSELTVMVLGTPFLRAAARWPALMCAVQQRLADQQARLIRQSLALHLPRAEHRVLLILWTLAQRCGRVRSDGLLLPLLLTHEALSRVTGARRSTVSLALATLRSSGHLIMREDGFLLTDSALAEIEAITAPRPGSTVGASITIARPCIAA
jgi:CRP/FNR family transcriptional regulator, cyclic AMP receptor protein